MEYTLKELLDIPRLRELLDALDELHSMPSAIIDTEGNVLTATAWQDICTKFHRVNSNTEKMCIASDRHIESRLCEKQPYVLYKCPMGLVNSAMPIIIEGKHLGNVFTGQLFMEAPDDAYFINQARTYGFDEVEYLEAMRKVPFFPEEKLHKNLNFIHGLAQILAEQGLQNKRLQESQDKHRTILLTSTSGFILAGMQGQILEVNTAYCQMSGFSEQELLAMRLFDLEALERPEDTAKRIRKIMETGQDHFESKHRRKDGSEFFVEVSTQYQPFGGGQCVAFLRDITDRKQAEAALKESEQKYRSLADSGQLLIWTSDYDNLCDYFNKFWLDFTGRTFEQEYGNGWVEGVHPDDVHYCLDTYVSAFDKREAFSMEYRLRRHDGEYRWLQDDGCPRYNSNGDFIGYIGYCLDITERKQAEDKRREVEEKFRNIFDHSLVGKSITTSDGKLMTNEAFCRIVGYREAELNNMTWQEITHPDDIAESSEIIDSIVSGAKESAIWKKRYINKDGHIVWVDISTTLQRDSSGAPLYFITSVVDITEQKQIEDALKISNEQNRSNLILLQSVINHFPGVVFWKDAESTYLGCNKNFSDAAGLTNPDKIVGKSDFDLPWAETEASHYRAIDRRVMDSCAAELHIIETQHQADGKVTWFDTSKVPIIDKDGAVMGILGASFDISEIKKVEEERMQLELQFQQTQKLESLGVLSGGIAHDFNNILAIIMGYCNLTKMDYETAEHNIQEIEKAANRAAGLCRQMLAYAGKAQLSMTRVNMWMVVDEMVGMLKATLPHNAVICPDLSPEIPLITADASQIRQIVMNLIINASEAIGTEQGEIRVLLTKTNVIAGQHITDHQGKEIPIGTYVCLEVTDTGCGMDEETKWRIFEPFYTTKFTGRGLGMSAVLGIITSHHGALQLFSQLGRGTTFKVYLPIVKSAATAGDEQKSSVSSAPWKGSGTILLVEDDESIRDIAKTFLEIFGFTVLEAANGKEALEIYQKNAAEIRLVLTDLGMPVMDGYALFPALKHLNPELPIIISSGFGDADVTSRIGSDNIAGIISKPYNPDQLRDILKKTMENALPIPALA